jgi:cytochrome c biogenesis protein CcmG/thiol:disulfide interchange protein DsbE
VGVLAFINTVGRPRDPVVDGRAAVDSPAPPVTGMTLDGTTFDLASLRGRPVILNFWGPSCIPCREEFPQFLRELDAHAADGLAIVGVLTDDPPEPARQFVAEYGATWPTVIDPDGSIKRTYRVVARPHTWFIDRSGVIRAMQIGGPMTDEEFGRHYDKIR